MPLFQDGVLLLNAEAELVWASQGAREILDFSASGEPGELFDKIWQTELQPLLTSIQASSGPQEKEFGLEFGDQLKSLSLQVEGLPADASSRYMVLIRDLTSVKRLESIESEFITNVSHELRTPLTSIKMAAESLQMGAIANEKFKERFLSNIQREADRLTRLVNELLVLSNVQDAKTALHPSSFGLDGLLEDVMSTMQPHARVNDIELIGEFAPNLPAMFADRDRILQVLINLVDNAIKCNRPNGSVTLQAQLAQDRMVFKVIDTGIGIPNIDLPRIFARFFRVDKSRSRVTGGTGLGLSIVKDIIEAHGGQIQVESTVNVGTTFIIDLPLRADLPQE